MLLNNGDCGDTAARCVRGMIAATLPHVPWSCPRNGRIFRLDCEWGPTEKIKEKLFIYLEETLKGDLCRDAPFHCSAMDGNV